MKLESKYEKYIYKYGIISVLITLEWLQYHEAYEECHEIIQAIKGTGIDLPTVLTKEVIEETIDELYKMTGKGNKGQTMLRYFGYATNILKEQGYEV